MGILAQAGEGAVRLLPRAAWGSAIRTMSRWICADTLQEQHGIQQQPQKLEKQQRRQRQDIFKAEDEIKDKRDSLIESLERRLAQNSATETLFTIRWALE